jgi:hypothetical protein
MVNALQKNWRLLLKKHSPNQEKLRTFAVRSASSQETNVTSALCASVGTNRLIMQLVSTALSPILRISSHSSKIVVRLGLIVVPRIDVGSERRSQLPVVIVSNVQAATAAAIRFSAAITLSPDPPRYISVGGLDPVRQSDAAKQQTDR